MNALPSQFEEMADLVWAMVNDRLDHDGALQLRQLLAESSANRRVYLQLMDQFASLEWEKGGGEGSGFRGPGSGARDQGAECSNHPSSFILQPSSIPPIVIDSTPSLHSTFGNLVFSHVAAAVILGIGLLIGLAWRISLPSLEKSNTPVVGNPIVGHITALADCKWAKQGSEVRGPGSGISEIQIPKSLNPQIPVFLGDRLLVSSGLMQITYDTGAVVLLQGPCTYEIDAADGGYLAVGKLTALVEKKAKESNPQSLIPNPLFAVRTPTAVVTDLGTEFGVEVEKSGATRSHVFQGTIEVRSSNSRRSTTSGELVEILQAGESARVERGRNSQVAIVRGPGQPDRFVRRIPSSLSQSSRTPDPRSLPPLYHLTDLGTLGGASSRAVAINNAGMVVGRATDRSGDVQAFLYANGKMQRLNVSVRRAFQNAKGEMQATDVVPGFCCAASINSLGQIVGYMDPAGECRAFLHSDAGTVVGVVGSRAQAINDAGTVVGFATNAQGVNRAFIMHAARKELKDLGALGGPCVELGI